MSENNDYMPVEEDEEASNAPLFDYGNSKKNYFGSRLCRARRRAGFTLRQLAEKVQMTPQALNRWELGEVSNPSASTMRKVADALELDPAQLFEWLERSEELIANERISRQLSPASMLNLHEKSSLRPTEEEVEQAERLVRDEKRLYRYFGTRVRRARRRAGLTLSGLSAATGISIQALNRWELGEVRNPNGESLRKVAEAMELNPGDQIFDWLETNEEMVRGNLIARQLGPSRTFQAFRIDAKEEFLGQATDDSSGDI